MGLIQRQWTLQVAPHQLQLLLWNGDPSRAAAAPLWRAVPVAG